MNVDVERITHELYGLRPSEFTAARDAHVAEARRAKDTAAAKEIAALRRPPLAVWAANLLARERPEEAERFLALGAALREAHRTLDGERLREAGGQQHRLVAALVRTAAGLAEAAGQPLSDTVLGDVERTLHAVLAHPDVAGPWSRGSLATLPEAAVGFPDVSPEARPRPAAARDDRGPEDSGTVEDDRTGGDRETRTTRETRAAREAREAEKAPEAENARQAKQAREAENARQAEQARAKEKAREAERVRVLLARRVRERDVAREAADAAKAAAEEAAGRLRRVEREREEARSAAAESERIAAEAETALRGAESALDEARRAAGAAGDDS
ncbi:hypothetical protein ACF1E9_17260 [Streptomyces roseolus]|uniref:hypothetical protein n=1 Tax=Streptomyces roseolus TaxID=67358 RepID=UPI00370335F8